jgi:hypothetical protein
MNLFKRKCGVIAETPGANSPRAAPGSALRVELREQLVYLKKSPSKSILPSSRKVRITCIASRRRESGLRFAPRIADQLRLVAERTIPALT